MAAVILAVAWPSLIAAVLHYDELAYKVPAREWIGNVSDPRKSKLGSMEMRDAMMQDCFVLARYGSVTRSVKAVGVTSSEAIRPD